MIGCVPRAATTSDPFNAIAEARRRDILVYLAADERPVSDLVSALGLSQPSVSKHLKVLRNVGLVHVRREGRQMLYRTNIEAIRPLHEWTRIFDHAEPLVSPSRPALRVSQTGRRKGAIDLRAQRRRESIRSAGGRRGLS
jgi:DNA-binding transcriptional ArsR family regulator